jgi:hypothetical protein
MNSGIRYHHHPTPVGDLLLTWREGHSPDFTSQPLNGTRRRSSKAPRPRPLRRRSPAAR